MDGVDLKTFAGSMSLATVIYFGLQHFQKNPVKSTLGKSIALTIVGAYLLISAYYFIEVIDSAKMIARA